MSGSEKANLIFVTLVLCGLANSPKSRAQSTPAQEPAFEVVSIKPYTPPAVYQGPPAALGMKLLPDRFTASQVTLRDLVSEAYRVETYQVTGVPAGLVSERYDVEAKAGPPASKDEVRSMLRRMLAERCKLAVHFETKEAPVYALVQAKDGARLVKIPDGDATPNSAVAHQIHFRIDMAELAVRLSGFLRLPLHDSENDTWLQPDRVLPVIDETGLNGRYDVPLNFPPALESDTFTTWQLELQRLGLKLVAKKAPMKYVVIDGLEKPSAN
jgi:uncharacterized protein (TIGR03435 family)